MSSADYQRYLEDFRSFVQRLPASDRTVPTIPIPSAGVVLSPAQALQELEAQSALGFAVYQMHVAGVRQLSQSGAVPMAIQAFLATIPPNIKIGALLGSASSRNYTASEAASLIAAGRLPELEAAITAKLKHIEGQVP